MIRTDGGMVCLKGQSVGATDAHVYPTYRLVDFSLLSLGGVGICDTCGCLHRSCSWNLCDSCFEAVRRVQRQQAMDGFLRAAREMAEAFRDAGDGLPYGHSPAWQALQSYGRALRKHHEPLVITRLGEPDARRFMAGHIDPVIGEHWVHDELITYKSARLGVDIVGEIERILTPTGIPREIYFRNISNRLACFRPQDAEPVMKRNARNRGPKPRGKWWLK